LYLPAKHKNLTCSRVWIDGRYLRWEIYKKKKISLSKEFFKSLATLENTTEDLVEFFEHYGPLWNGENIFIPKALSQIRTFQLFCLLTQGAKDLGIPKVANELMKRFFIPIDNWQIKWEHSPIGKNIILPANFEEDIQLLNSTEENTVIDWILGKQSYNKDFKLRLMIAKSGETQFLPYEPSPKVWPLFSVPPRFKNWEEKKDWLYKQLLFNAKNLLHNELDLKLILRKGRIVVLAQPANAFAWATAKLVLDSINRCQNCGAYTNTGRYCSRKCEIASMKTGIKQSFFDYLNKQVKRGNLTQEECVLIKEHINETFKPGEETKKTILRKALRLLNKQFPGRDFTFLNGFGSRKLKEIKGVN